MNKYKTLIQNLPLNEHGFPTKRGVWKAVESKNLWLEKQNDKIFGEDKTRIITRGELLQLLKNNPNNIEEFLLLVIYWGYPSGMRGNYFEEIITENNRNKLIDIIKRLLKSNNIDDFDSYYEENIKGFKGLGLSTFSKFLYFLETKIEGKLAIILDLKLIDVLRNSEFKRSEFSTLSYNNAPKKFVKYLEYIQEEAGVNNASEGQIEMFLFIFGPILTTK